MVDESDNKTGPKLKPGPSQTPLREGLDYYVDELGRFIFTREYHLARGTCCENGCKHCPYGFTKPSSDF